MHDEVSALTVCNVCRSALDPPILPSEGDVSLTSLGTIRRQRTVVRFCSTCGHLQTDALPDADGFYAEEYDILVASDEEDQLYEVRGDERVFRVEHQLETLFAQCKIPHDARVLDFGCAKGAMARALLRERPDLRISLFDVSERYRPFWVRIVDADLTAVGKVPEAWTNHFDLVISFFVLEHVVDLAGALATVRRCLKPGGTFYFLVPNMQANIADLVVVDHCNHFSPSSLQILLRGNGFESVVIDENAHASAFVARARRTADKDSPPSSIGPAEEIARHAIDSLRTRVHGLCDEWRAMGERVREFESRVDSETPAAVYGSGFYGAFLTTCLARPERVVCYVDRNPHRQQRKFLDRPILAPTDLPDDVGVVFVGLNPKVARSAIADVGEWADRPLRYFFL